MNRTVTAAGLTYAALLAGTILLDALVRPRASKMGSVALREWSGLWLLVCITGALFGLFLAICGNGAVALALALALQALLLVASNAKYAMLGEPLLFSDLALIGAIFRHPQFYLSAVPIWQRVGASIAGAAMLGVIVWLSSANMAAHLVGATALLSSLGALALSLRGSRAARIVSRPDADADTRRLGLYPTLLLYWLRWRESRDPPPCPINNRQAPHDPPELVVIIQCESFADPVELFDDPALSLPGLTAAREHACQWGNMLVSGFGAYTMRTEYGVLFGREEKELGFRRYDPFLTALGEASYALPNQLGTGWHSLFLHPHDMRFYGRDRIMPAAGFAELVGEEHFTPPGPNDGRYVTDAAITDEIIAIAESVTQPTMIYAVTIENHGPWASGGAPGRSNLAQGYLRLVRRGDGMLQDLTQRIAALGRPALLVFFGDHRPSIPGAVVPGCLRHTPYVMVRIDTTGRIIANGNSRLDLTPAGLHQSVLDAVLGEPV